MNEKKAVVTIGIDVSKDKLDIWFEPVGQHEVIANTEKAIGKWMVGLFKKHTIEAIGFEPTGGYEKCLAKILVEKYSEVPAFELHPSYLKQFGRGEGIGAKTDRVDARTIARYLCRHRDRLRPIGEKYVEEKQLNDIFKRMEQLKAMVRAESCREKHTFFDPALKRSIQRHMKQLEKELSVMQAHADKLIAASKEHCDRQELLMTFKGVGKVTAQALIMEMPELGRLNKREVARLMGVAPMSRDSGKYRGHRYIHGGRTQLRAKLYMAALVAIRYNPTMKAVYERLRTSGKPGKVALTAVMRRIIVILNAMVKHNQPWENNMQLISQNA